MMAIADIFIKLINKANDWSGKILFYLIFPIFIIILLEVFLRYLFNAPTIWANELSQLLFGLYCMLAGGPILSWKGHINVDIIYLRFNLRGKAIANIVGSLLFFVFCGTLIHAGSFMAWDSLCRLEHSESPWNPPLYPFKLAIPIGSIMLMLQGIADLICSIRTLIKGEGESIKFENEDS